MTSGGSLPAMTGTSERVREWRVRRDRLALKALASAFFMLLAVVVAGDWTGAFLAGAAALVLGVAALRDVLLPVRLAADGDGLTLVQGFAARHRVPWPEVVHIRVDRPARYGLRWEVLEIETAEDLYLFGSGELGAGCEEAAEELFRLRPGRA
jgi:hypothetical protein